MNETLSPTTAARRVTLGRAGRIVIPAALRAALDIGPDAELLLREVPEGILITTHDAAVKNAQRLVKKRAGKRKRLASEELIAERRAEARRQR